MVERSHVPYPSEPFALNGVIDRSDPLRSFADRRDHKMVNKTKDG